jgi:hypothetical protein
VNSFLITTCSINLENFVKNTQVRSPAVLLRLARCTSWVKRWSEAMDFLQTIFKTNIFLSRILEIYVIKGPGKQRALYYSALACRCCRCRAINFSARKLLQNFVQKYKPVSRFLIDPISITYMLQSTLVLENCYKFLCKNISLYQDF